MAVYTHVSAEALSAFLERYDVGELVSAKGIAEGVENSNYLVDTTNGRFFLTLYEKRVEEDDLPYFLGLMNHLADRGNPVPRAIPDRSGQVLQQLADRSACLIEFLPGLSPSHPTPEQAYAVGQALAQMHLSCADFAMTRDNMMGVGAQSTIAKRKGFDFDAIRPGLGDRVHRTIGATIDTMDRGLPKGTIHADLFPDNVLMRGDAVAGLIDFYFACTGDLAWDLAVTHSAWCFDGDGLNYRADVGTALVAGYGSVRPLTSAERGAMPVLARSACMRFLLTRAWDWLHTPADALVTRKDPVAYLNRLDFYEANPHVIA